jgi:hypothetical protein
MKKILLGIAAVFALSTFAAPAFAEDKPAADKAEKKPAKKAKKAKGDKKEEKKEEAK